MEKLWGMMERPDKVWICPAAPAGPRPPDLAPDNEISGTVFSAWWDAWPTDAAGSYGFNEWINYPRQAWDTWLPSDQIFFRTESDIAYPTLTPILADCSTFWRAPRSSDRPPKNLFSPDLEDTLQIGAMKSFCIPRHGSRPNPVPTNWPRTESLPGAVNVSFFDGHGELVKLDRLWQLYWHRDYQLPAKWQGLR